MIRCIFTGILLLVVGVASAQTLSLSEAIGTMQSHNSKHKGIEKQAQAAEYGTRSLRGLYYPKLSINANYLHMSDNLYLDLNPIRERAKGLLGQNPTLLVQFPQLAALMPYMQTDWHYEFQKQDVFRLSADANWVLYAGGKIRAGVRAGKIQSEISKNDLQNTQTLLISELASRYFQTKLAHEAVEVRTQALRTAQLHYDNARKLEAHGMTAAVETMQAASAVADAQREVAAARKDLQLAQAALVATLGTDVSMTELSTPLFEVKPLQPLEYYQQSAVENHPLLVKAGWQYQLAEQNIRAQRAGFLPQMALVGKKYVWSENLPITEPDNWYVGVGLQWTLFDGLQDKHKYQQAKALKESVSLLKNQAETDIQLLVQKYYIEIEKQREQVVSLQESIRFAEELVRARNKAFAEGLSTSEQVADANLYWASLQIKQYQALFEMDKHLALLLEASGLGNTLADYLP